MRVYHIFLSALIVLFIACSDSDRDKDIFGFSGGADGALSIEVANIQDESLIFKSNIAKSVFANDAKKPTLLFFLSKDCSECQGELMHIIDLFNKYQNFITILAIAPKDELESLQSDVDNINPRFKLYAPSDNKHLLSFLNKDSAQSYIALYDRQGAKVADYIGLVPEEMIELDIIYQIKDELELKAQDEAKQSAESSQDSTDSTLESK